MMEFTYDGFVRWGFGFHNPNHAAAAICAVLPFVWGCGRAETRSSRWMAAVTRWIMTGVLFSALALTYSRTGFVVAALEAVAWAGLGRAGVRPSQVWSRQARRGWFLLIVLGGLVATAVVGGVCGRFTPDAAALNRPKIWWAGLKLAAANPSGVGHGLSGLLASTFLLDGIEVRTLVNSHVTLLAEYGRIVGFAWLAFVIAAVGGGCVRAGARPSLWVAFAGLTISACMASVFDWHVLFDWDGMGDLGGVNFVLSWILFAAYLVMGILLIVLKRREGCPERDRPSEARHTWRFTLGGILRAVCSGICGACAFVVLLLFVPTVDVPKVRNGFVVKDGASMPLVLHDAEWSLAAVLPYLETDGYRLAIEPGYQEPDVFPRVAWLFGTCAESAHRFTNVAVTIVSPPEFCILPPGTQVIR